MKKKLTRELIMYSIFGILTTLVNYAAYFALTDLFDVNYLLSNILAWYISVVFSYIVNRRYVFEEKAFGRRNIAIEYGKFTATRIFSVIIDVAFMWFFVEIIKLDDGIVKLINGVIIAVLNYILTKLLVFRKKKTVVKERHK
jgi:putative flippase GtrA